MRHTRRSMATTIPLVFHVGFVGSRVLFDSAPQPELDADEIAKAVQDDLVDILRRLPDTLGLSRHHFLCGASQIAIGADTLFTRVCQHLSIPQRILLPQRLDDYLQAHSSNGASDFSPTDQQIALDLLNSPHVIETSVVSHAGDRGIRFEETNAEILRMSDILICLVREGADAKRGGTMEMLDRAHALGKPVIKLTIAIEESRVTLLPTALNWEKGAEFALPSMPKELVGLEIPAQGNLDQWITAKDYIQEVKHFASRRSKARSGWFKRSALIIIGFHLIATFLAILAGRFHATIVPLLLSAELMFLITGLAAHSWLHRGAHARIWAVNRLVAETMRSLAEVDNVRGDLQYLPGLPIPEGLLPLMRTSKVLHLGACRATPIRPWTERRDAYVERRLTTGPNAQLAYYLDRARGAESQLRIANSLFWLFSLGAITAAVAELLLNTVGLPELLLPAAERWGGVVAVVLPVAAVGFLSWAAAGDLEARVQTFGEMHTFIERQVERFNASTSEPEFSRLIGETESRLLGETLNWFSRRSFSSVA